MWCTPSCMRSHCMCVMQRDLLARHAHAQLAQHGRGTADGQLSAAAAACEARSAAGEGGVGAGLGRLFGAESARRLADQPPTICCRRAALRRQVGMLQWAAVQDYMCEPWIL